jgi:energy-coupling factor transport system permease protein
VIALATAAVAFGLSGWTGPLSMLVLGGVSVVGAGITRRTVPFVVASTPLVASILLVNTFLYPGASDPLVVVGPFIATGRGLAAAAEAGLRVLAFTLSVAVLALTTSTTDLLADLERRGLGRRAVFVIGSAISALPRLRGRAMEIADAQRARGLDTEGSLRNRVRGLVPLAGPLVASALVEVEDRTIALEARAFSAPGRRTALRTPPDSRLQRAARWLVALGTAGLIALSVSGTVRLP